MHILLSTINLKYIIFRIAKSRLFESTKMEEKPETPFKENMGLYSQRIRKTSNDTKEQEATFDDTGNNNPLVKTLLKEEDLSTLP